MMVRSLLTGALIVCAVAAPVSAQNRVDQQIFADLRMLQEQVQKLQLAVNALAEQLKHTNSTLDAQTKDLIKRFADQGVRVEAIASSVTTLREQQSDHGARISKLSLELTAIREALTNQQTLLNQILGMLQPPIDPTAPPGAPPGAPPTGGTIPSSPQSLHDAAFGYFTEQKHDLAIDLFREYLKKYPDSPDAPRVQLYIGDSFFHQKKYKEGLDAYSAVIKNYKDSPLVAEAYYKQGVIYEALGQRANAQKSYETIISKYPQSDAFVFAQQRLKAIKGG